MGLVVEPVAVFARVVVDLVLELGDVVSELEKLELLDEGLLHLFEALLELEVFLALEDGGVHSQLNLGELDLGVVEVDAFGGGVSELVESVEGVVEGSEGIF